MFQFAIAAEGLHPTGLLYSDPRLNPELTQVFSIPLEPGKNLLPYVDLSSQMPQVGDQGTQWSCVGWAVGYYHKTHTEWIEHGWDVNLPQNQFSPSFIYNQINGGADNGSYFADAMKVITDNGDANIVLCPYNQWDWTSWPSENAYSWAIPHRGDDGFWIDCSNNAGLTVIKTRLYIGYTTVLGIQIWSNFDSIGLFNNTYCVVDRYGANRGDHAVTFVGYDDNRVTNDGIGAFKLVNSWGTGWGSAGYFWMSYQAVKDIYLSQRLAFYVTDRIGYNPLLKMYARITHNARERVGIRFGFGPSSAPRGTKDFFNYIMNPHLNHSFPNNNMVFDMTDNIASLGPDSTVFLRCIDNTSDGITGTINFFSTELVMSFSKTSSDPPVTIPDYNIPVYASILMRNNIAWVALYNGPGNDIDRARAITLDGSGNVYVTGESYGSGTDNDYATIKYNSSGVQQWVQRYNGSGNSYDKARAIALDSSGNVYVTGSSYGSGTYCDYATIKYNSAGVAQWVQRYNGTGNSDDMASSLAVDGQGNMYVTGHSYGSGTSSSDYATIKYNSAGVLQWITRYDGPGNNSSDQASSLAIDGQGNVYVTGYSDSSGIGECDYVTIKYNSAGVEQWVARYNGPGNGSNCAYSLVVDGQGNVYVTGISIGAGAYYDYATVKYNANGVQQWAARYNGPGNYEDWSNVIAVDEQGNVYVTGRSGGSGTDYDYATIKYNSAGVEQWIARYNGPGNDIDEASSLVIDGLGNVYVTGQSVGAGTWNDYATIKYNSAGVQQWVARYDDDRPGNGDDYATSLAIDGLGNVYVTGSGVSMGSGTNDDYATIKYVQTASAIEERMIPLTQSIRRILLDVKPNPFRSQATILYSLPTEGKVSLLIYDVSGRLVKTLVNEFKSSGVYTALWNGIDDNGRKVGQGVYFYVLKTNNNKMQKKMLMLK